MKRRYTIAASALAVSSLFASSFVTSADAGTTTPTTASEEAFRSTLDAYLQNLGAALGAASHNPLTQAAIAPTLQDQTAAIAVAEQQIPLLTAAELDAMQGILGTSPTWQKQPTILQQRLSQVSTAAPAAAAPAGFLSDCSASLGDPRGLFYGYWIAAQVASAANAVASGMPDGVDFVAADIIAGVIFGVANGIAIILAGNLSLSSDCTTAVANAALAATYPTDPSAPGPSHLTPASSQISVNILKLLAGGIQAALDSIQTVTNRITLKLQAAGNSFGVSQGVANDIQTISTDLQVRTDALIALIGAPADTGTGTAHGLANTINAREDTTLSNTDAFQALSTRAEIERNLATPSTGPVVAMFALPAVQGGLLETVRDIVTATIASELAAGQSVGQAQTDLAAGNAALTAMNYETAYRAYASAYLKAVA